MKRLAICLFISAYLGSLSWGIVAHAVKYKVGSHPAMYFVVWDMFCGWSAYSSRTQIIAEGESGRYYEVSPAPWGELTPFGHIERRHYDPWGDLMPNLIRNNLRNTSHEPITNVYVVEELWPKQYNLPDKVWKEQFNKPKDVRKYYNIVSIHAADGKKTQCRPTWLARQFALSVSDNPRLQKQAAMSQPYYTVSGGGAGMSQRGSMAPQGN